MKWVISGIASLALIALASWFVFILFWFQILRIHHSLPSAVQDEMFASLAHVAKMRCPASEGDDYLTVDGTCRGFNGVITKIEHAVRDGYTAPLRPDRIVGKVLVLDSYDKPMLVIKEKYNSIVINGYEFEWHDAQLDELLRDVYWDDYMHYPNGALRAKGMFDSGHKDGQWTYFFETGEKRAEGRYQKDKKVGTWTTRDKKGNVQGVEHFPEATPTTR